MARTRLGNELDILECFNFGVGWTILVLEVGCAFKIVVQILRKHQDGWVWDVLFYLVCREIRQVDLELDLKFLEQVYGVVSELGKEDVVGCSVFLELECFFEVVGSRISAHGNKQLVIFHEHREHGVFGLVVFGVVVEHVCLGVSMWGVGAQTNNILQLAVIFGDEYLMLKAVVVVCPACSSLVVATVLVLNCINLVSLDPSFRRCTIDNGLDLAQIKERAFDRGWSLSYRRHSTFGEERSLVSFVESVERSSDAHTFAHLDIDRRPNSGVSS